MDRRKLAALAFLAVVANGAAIFYTAHVTRGEEPVIPPPGQAFVQLGGVPFQGEEYSDVALPTERDEIRKLEKIGQLIAESRFSDAAILLDRVLLKDEDSFFVPGEDKTNFRSLKSEAARLIGTLPAKGIEAYRLQFGTLAAKALAEAVPTGDMAALTEISRRYFHTQAGYDATFILARHHLDHDRPMAAAMCYQQLLDSPRAAARFEPTLSVLAAISWSRAGMERRAEQTLTRLKRRDPDAQLQIADRSVGLFARGTDSLAWLSRTVGRQLPSDPRRQNEWTTFRGDASRNGESAGGRPLLAPRWRVRIANHPAVEKAVKRIQQSYMSQGIASLPSLHPLAVGDVILTRTARQLIAVDFKTGKRVWEELSNRDNIFEGLTDSGQRQSPSSRDLLLDAQLQRRLWGNVPYGTLSSDGQRVFVIQDFGLITDRSDLRFNIIPGQQRFRVSPQGMSNRLSAFELRTEGKLLWEIGGADSEIKELQDAFFLGPPLVLSGALHALVEIRGGIRLVVLEPQIDSATGRETVKLVWSQQLADVEETIAQDRTRRLAGATPSYADGVLVCPTSAGAVVAVDLARRSLLWAYKYPPRPGNRIRGRRGMRGLGQAAGKASDRWVDATATLVDGRVLLTPVESGEIHCLDLLDGKLLWKQKRGENLYVAQVHEGKVILVGHRSMTALALADGGKAAWSPSEMMLPDGSMPSGRGFSSGNHYY
ncbi:MAG: PQQ-binding-like beta-propeller repeat protein, partial [Thermoguttaceae bacterium]